MAGISLCFETVQDGVRSIFLAFLSSGAFNWREGT